MPSAERISDIVSNALSQYGLGFGNVFYVSSTQTGASDSAGRGLTPETALLTVATAISRASADNGDVIVTLPTHVEVLTAAGTNTMSKAGVSILGVGRGRSRGRFNYTTSAAASFNVTAARCSVFNCVFTATGVDAVTAAINVSAADFTLEGCEMELADATNQAVLGILTTAAADRMRIVNNRIHGTADAGTATAIRIVGGSNSSIIGNFITGAYTTSLGGIENNTTIANRLQIDGNTIINATASSTVCVAGTSNPTGSVTNNRLSILSGTAPITGTGWNVVGGNYYKAAAGVAAGTLL